MTESRPRVLFIHGLEGHPEGTKVQLLREQGFEVHAADMHMSVRRLDKHNSILRNLLRARELKVAGLGMATGLGLSVVGARPWPALAGVAIAGGWLSQRREHMIATATGRSFDRCVEIQAAAVQRVEPDILIGSSWGGAVAAELLISGVWSGPTILLAPALRKVAERAQRTDPSEALGQLEREQAILVFHDPSDDVVPHADSVELGRGECVELRSVDAGGHRLIALLERGELAEAIHAMVGERE